MVLCWSAADSVQCQGGYREAFWCFHLLNAHMPKSSAPFPNTSGAALSTLLKWSWFRKKAALWCDPVQPCFSLPSWESDAHLRAWGVFGFEGEMCYCLSAVTPIFNDSFRRQWACDKQGNSKAKDVVNLKAWGSISPVFITCRFMMKIIFCNP